MPISKNTIKFLRSLHQKKFRTQHQLFLVEGEKMALEFLDQSKIQVQSIYGKEDWLVSNENTLAHFNGEINIISQKTLERISVFNTPNQVVLLCEMPESNIEHWKGTSDTILFLDQIQNPGNLGTILRTGDWFGIRRVICSPNSADFFNPKTIQSTMGAIARVETAVCHMAKVVQDFPDHQVLGTFIEGKSIYKHDFSGPCIIVIGNESQGISEEVAPFINTKINIPSVEGSKMESLNAAIAAGIVMAQYHNRLVQRDH